MKILLLLCIFCSFSFLEVFGGRPRLQDAEVANYTHNRTKRQWDSLLDHALDWTREGIENASKCAERAGCHKGYCWTWCGLSLSSGDWCYTTRTYSQSFNYVRCSSDSECNPCWKCAGSCTL